GKHRRTQGRSHPPLERVVLHRVHLEPLRSERARSLLAGIRYDVRSKRARYVHLLGAGRLPVFRAREIRDAAGEVYSGPRTDGVVLGAFGGGFALQHAPPAAEVFSELAIQRVLRRTACGRPRATLAGSSSPLDL